MPADNAEIESCQRGEQEDREEIRTTDEHGWTRIRTELLEEFGEATDEHG